MDQACRRLRLPRDRDWVRKGQPLCLIGDSGTGTSHLLIGLDENLNHPRLCAAIMDRLTSNGTIIETGTDSYRFAHTLGQSAAS